MPRRARGADHRSPQRRFLAFYIPCGIVMNSWTPADRRPGWAHDADPDAARADTATRSLVLIGHRQPARPLRWRRRSRVGHGRVPDLHARRTRPRAPTSEQRHLARPTARADAARRACVPVARARHRRRRQRRRLRHRATAARTRASISWQNATTPLPKQTSPRAVFDRLFAGYDPNETPPSSAPREGLSQERGIKGSGKYRSAREMFEQAVDSVESSPAYRQREDPKVEEDGGEGTLRNLPAKYAKGREKEEESFARE